MKKYYLFLIITFGLFTSVSTYAQNRYKIQYTVTVTEPTTNDPSVDPGSDGTCDMFFGESIFSLVSRFQVGTYTRDDVLEFSTPITGFDARSVREPNQADIGCTIGVGARPFNNLTQSTLPIITQWDCVPNVRGRFNVQYIQDIETLNQQITPGPRQADICDPLSLTVGIAPMSYELLYSIDNSPMATFPGFEYPQETVIRGVLTRPTYPGTVSLDLSQINGIADAGVIIFQVRYSDNDLNPSRTITYNMVPCEIKLDNPGVDNPRDINPVCNGNTDGGFEFRFERELEADETLLITVDGFDTNGDPVSLLTTTLTTTDLPGGVYEFTGVKAGVYDLVWILGSTDGSAFGPSDPITRTLTDPLPITFTQVSENVGCFGANDGTIVVTAQEGSQPYEYSIQNGITGSYQDSNQFLNLASGDYQIVVRDSNGCTSEIDSPVVNIAEGSSPPSFDYLPSSTPSAQNAQGAIDVFVSGGQAPYSFLWTKDDIAIIPAPANPTNLTGLNPGSYKLLVTDDNGCTSDPLQEPFIITAIPNLTVTINQSNFIYCEGEITTLTATGAGGTGGYLYSWSTVETTPSINAGAGSYTVTVTDSSNDTATSTSFDVNYVDRNDTATIITNALAVTVTNVTDVFCSGESTGRIALDITGGLGPYEVFWDGTFTEGPQDNSTLTTGNHTYEVVDANSCSVSGGPIFIDEPTDGLELTGVKINDVSTNNGTDGTIELTITNGTGPFQFNWGRQETDGSYAPYTAIEGAGPLEFTGFTAGTYLVTVVDGTPPNTCSATLTVPITIIEPGPLRINTPASTITAVNCFGESTGRIDASYEGTAPFEFVWLDNLGVELKRGPDDFIDNLPAGTYSYTINDTSNAGPITSTAIIIAQPTAALAATFAQTEVTCLGGNDGTITVNATGGTAPLQYQISGGLGLQLTPGEFTNLEAGNYTVNVTDANNCSLPALLFDLVLPTQITFDDANAVTPVSVPGGSDGSISVTVQGGAQPYFYRWTGPNGLVAPINTPPNNTRIENLTEGIYTLEVSNTDAFIPDGCYFIRSYTVGEQDAFSVQPLVAEVSCFAADNGSLTATIEATGPVIFRWFNVNDTVNPVAEQITEERIVTLDGLAPGTYFLEIESTIPQVVRSADVLITELPEIEVAFAVQATCIGEATGRIDFNPQGAFINRYTYSINDGAMFQADPVFENLEGGAYNLRVRVDDNVDCELVLTGVTIQDSPVILWNEASSVITRSSGPGAADGEITPVFTGGIPPYEYSIDGGATFQPDSFFPGLGAGTYTVLVTDAAGCSIVSGNMVVTEVGPLTISDIVPTNALCLGEANGSVTTTVSGEGTIIYEWTLANGDPVPVSNGINGPNITGILAGNYILTVTDINSTVVSAPIGIDEPATAVTITNSIPTDIACFGGNNGSLEIQAAGGTAPYTYSVNGGAFQDSPLFSDLFADDYTVSVQDVNGCVFTELVPILLLEPQPLNIIVNEQVPVTAANQSDGAIFVTVEGGSGTYTYEWTGPNGFTATEEDITNIGAGDYVLTVTDANFAVNNDAGCTLVSDPILVTEPGELVVTVNQTVLLECSGDDFAEITANVQGGVLPYQYQWFQISNGNNINLQEDTNIIGNLSAGDYFLRITDANGITVDSDIVTITQPTILQIAVDAFTNVLCAGQPTGAINISVSGGTPPYQYGWSNGATVPDISALDAGEYSVVVEDANNCFAEATITISAPDDAIQIVDAFVENVSAYEGSDGSIQLNISGGLTPYEYSWTRLSDNLNLGDTPTITNLLADSYAVAISDANGCTLTETYVVTQPDIVEETLVQPSCADSSDGSISVLVNFGNGNFEYLWSTGATENTITNLIAGTYSVMVTGFEAGPITRTYVLENPDPIIVNLGSDRVLCQDQTLDLDATVSDATATYTWTSDNGFTSSEPIVTLSQTGNYNLVVRTATGCTAEGGVSVTVSTDEIDAEFAVSTQAFVDETLIAVDISFPLPEGVEWIIPLGANVVSQNTDAVELSFAEVGEYEITLITTRGDCVAQKTKKVLVVARDGLISEEDVKNNTKLVEDFIVYPNPTSGRFTADINLSERGEVGIKIFSFANNALVASHKDRGAETYSIPFDISGMPSGVYAVLLETSYGTSLRKIVVR